MPRLPFGSEIARPPAVPKSDLMKSALAFLLFAIVLTITAHAACSCGGSCACSDSQSCACAKPDEVGHPLRGVVTRRLEDKQLVLIRHEAIPGFMPAMTMAFSVPEEAWPLLQPDVHLTATMQGERGDWRLTNVVLTDESYTSLPAPQKKDGYPLRLQEVASPAGAGSLGSTLTRGADGSIWLSWLETDQADHSSLRVAPYDPSTQTWGDVRVVADGSDWFVNWADFPALAVEADGRLTAVWFVNNPAGADSGEGHAHHRSGYQAWLSHGTDSGRTWSKPERLTTESTSVEFVSLQHLAGGGLLAVWLDGRGKRAGSKAQQLFGRVIGREQADTLIDASVCDCCQTSLTAFPNGDALVAYRARRDGEIRDIYTTLYREGRWQTPRILSADEWSIAGCPVNGPQLASHGGQVAAVWFTAAANAPRVYVTASPDAGARFLLPQRIDLGHPLGRVDTVQLRDGSRLVTWLEGGGAEAGVWLRRISARDEIGPPIHLAVTKSSRASGFPRLILVKDYDTTPAQLLLSYTVETDDSTRVETLLLTLPDLSRLTGRAPCLPCDEDDALASRGYGVKGRVTDWPGVDEVTLRFEEIPGVMRRGQLNCKVEPELQAALPVGQRLLGRIEQRDGEWWLFAVKPLGEPIK